MSTQTQPAFGDAINASPLEQFRVQVAPPQTSLPASDVSVSNPVDSTMPPAQGNGVGSTNSPDGRMNASAQQNDEVTIKLR